MILELAVVSEIAEVEEKQPHLTNVGRNDPFCEEKSFSRWRQVFLSHAGLVYRECLSKLKFLFTQQCETGETDLEYIIGGTGAERLGVCIMITQRK